MTPRTYTLTRIRVLPEWGRDEGLTFDEAVARAQHWVARFGSDMRGIGVVVTNEELRFENETGLTSAEQQELDEAVWQARQLARVA